MEIDGFVNEQLCFELQLKDFYEEFSEPSNQLCTFGINFDTDSFFRIFNKLFIILVNFTSNISTDTELFVESEDRIYYLNCDYSIKSENEHLHINETSVIDHYKWYFNGNFVVTTNGSIIELSEIKEENSGTYMCKIVLKNKQTIESEPFPLIVYKCNYFQFQYLILKLNILFVIHSKTNYQYS